MKLYFDRYPVISATFAQLCRISCLVMILVSLLAMGCQSRSISSLAEATRSPVVSPSVYVAPATPQSSATVTLLPESSPTATETLFSPTVPPTVVIYPRPGRMYLGLGDELRFEGENWAFSAYLGDYEEFVKDYEVAYSSISIEEEVRGNVNLTLHSSRWDGEPNPGEILLRAYASEELVEGDTLLWRNETTGEELTLILVGARLGIPEGEYEQFHELPTQLRLGIGQEVVEEDPDSRAAYLIKAGHMLTIITCDSRPGHIQVNEDETVSFPELTGFVFVYY